MLDNPRVRAYVLGLQKCLPRIPPRLRTVLQLRVGLTQPRRSARAVAARLHVSRERLRALEVRALRELSQEARTSGCATVTESSASAPWFAPVGFVSSFAGGSAGGVAGGLYFKEPAEPGAESIPPAEAIPGPPLRVTQSDDAPLIWALGVGLAGLLIVTILVRSDMGLGAPGFVRGRRRRSGPSDRPDRGDGSDGSDGG